MNDITQLFNSLLQQYGSIDIAEAEFKSYCMKMKNCKKNIASGVMLSEVVKKRFP